MTVSSLLLPAIALCAGAIGLIALRGSPRTTVVVWTLSLFFVPIWIGIVVGSFWALTTLVTVAAIIASARDIRLTVADGLVAAFAMLVIVLFAVNSATLAATVLALSQWVLPYIWGRLVLARVPAIFVTRVIAVIATAAAVLAILEFATGYNFFVTLEGSGGTDNWRGLQPRGSFLRAEGAFGHSIALGASLAMASVFVVASRWRTPLLLSALGLVLAGVVLTLSRIGLVAVVIALTLSVVMMPTVRRRVRVLVGVGGAAAALLAVPFVQAVFADEGEVAAESAQYRESLLALVPEVRVLGTAGDWSGLTVDGVYLGAFANSVDNAMLVIGLRFGWVPALLVAAVFALLAMRVLRGRANPPTIAVVSQLPALFTVALITQWGMFLWFLVGLAVAWGAIEDDRASSSSALSLPSRALRPTGGGASG